MAINVRTSNKISKLLNLRSTVFNNVMENKTKTKASFATFVMGYIFNPAKISIATVYAFIFYFHLMKSCNIIKVTDT